MDKYLKETKMLDYSNENIQQLIRERRWKNINEFERLKSIYDFVRDEILFGYNIDDNVPASKVLADGYGQCNTKGTLFMAILRACNIPCRVHGFTIDKKLQKGAMTGVVYKNAPQNVFHSWVEVYFEDRWYELEAFILDKKYLQKLQEKNSDCKGAFCGYGVAVKDFKNPIIDLSEIIYVFLTIFLYLLKCPQSLILSALRAFCFCGKPHISRSIFLYFRYQAWLKSW